ncbi:UvrD-helicase domain-containing protein [Phytoactinopolyspora halotolerans]|uniref:DNA 3'-5' helicase n=1 Tax=Phytoactinopolyspora halotolerans TaxID=1981512 RepID=A0A6L9S205_9ACTN|nr:UvrD-helicase domain-containing protein [Phytoactinopolyspora halotolerans]NED99056.1 UvrD-helicase domain-containing protein [Phytoactinopolyspora halotolerans]
MRFYADLHIHSKYSRACSKDCDLQHLTWWAKRKGIRVVGTGDVTHPAWFAHLEENLIAAEPGLFRLRPEIERGIDRDLPPGCVADVSFMLSVEISTIYKRADRTRKVHHLVYLPDFEAAAEFNRRLGAIGNLGSDGRPILGLDSRDLLEIALESGEGSYLVPAHVWTPWFSVLGSKAGFDAVDDCYLDLADHIFALETGLSADPAMMWRVSALDRYRLVSHSDAHSPPMLGREASRFDTDVDYYAIKRSLETGDGYLGSVEFFPEEGKYHLDGHRKCEVRLEPARTRELDGRCPECGKPLTVGVLSRVEDLADRPEGYRPARAPGFRSLIQLPHIMGEILGVGPKSKKVQNEIASLVAVHGPELAILDDVPVDELSDSSPQLAEAVRRLREGAVIREAGYDGEYGTIRLFTPDELDGVRNWQALALFDDGLVPQATKTPKDTEASRTPKDTTRGSNGAASPEPDRPVDVPPRAGQALVQDETPALNEQLPGLDETPAVDRPPPVDEDGVEILDVAVPIPEMLIGLDPDQRAAAALRSGPLLIVAGPGTGKTRTLTHRIAHLVTEHGVAPEQCLAITFTRKAAGEMIDRLHTLIPDRARELTVTTFHAFGLRVLRERHRDAGLTADFQVADDARRLEVLTEVLGDEQSARRILPELSRVRRSPQPMDPETVKALDGYLARLRELDLVDFDDLVGLPVELLEADPDLVVEFRERYRWISVDEYQDIDAMQYRLLRLLAPAGGNVTAIGDPDQAIYRFRGADVGFFLRFQQDFPSAETIQLTRNYRSDPHILTGAMQAVRPSTLVPDRVLMPVGDHPEPRKIGVHEAPNEHAEAAFVTRTIDGLLGGSSFHSRDSGRADGDGDGGIGFADVAVLYRTAAQAEALMDAFARAGYPYQRHSHDRLVERPGVRDLLTELTFASPATAAPDVPAALRRAAETVLARTSTLERSERSAELYSAIDLLRSLAAECGSDLERFRQELLLGAEVDALDPRADRVSLLTLHAAKGLEFPVVFIVGCEEGLLPFRWPGEDLGDEDLAEERRLFFVGMTRAQRMLYLTHAAERTWRGQSRTGSGSPFLSSLDGSVYDRLDGEGVRRRRRVDQLTLM